MKTLVLLILLMVILFHENSFSQNLNSIPPGNNASKNPVGQYFGLKPPGSAPEVFAPEIPFFTTRKVNSILYSPDGKYFYIVANDSLFYMKSINGLWTTPEIVFGDFKKISGFSISPDGNTMLLTINGDVMSCKREGNNWSLPEKLHEQVSSEKYECGNSMAMDHSIYYASQRNGTKGNCDIFYSKFKDGKYETPINLEKFNTNGSECGVYISPKDEFIIFTGFDNREGGYGSTDLYISFTLKDGSWSAPQSMGSQINTKDAEWPLSISPDGRYFFFNRYHIASKISETYWVDSKIISELNKQIKN
ncbi:MAG: hypothetical protein NTY07_14360 [Bacteroidia bacterium]|nr:hypothetical protein [Bacteroidia bacterium]